MKLVMTEWREKYDRESYASAVVFRHGEKYYLWQLRKDDEGYFHTGRWMFRAKNLCRPVGEVEFKELYPDEDQQAVISYLKIQFNDHIDKDKLKFFDERE